MSGRDLTPVQAGVVQAVRHRAWCLRTPNRTEAEVRVALILENWPRAAIKHVMAEGAQ